MARNRPNPLDDPPAASSSEEQRHEEEEEEEEDDEEVQSVEEEEDDDVPNAQPNGSESDDSDEEEEDEEEDEEEEEEEELKKEDKIPPQPSQPKPLQKNPNSDDEDDETESDSDTRSPGVSGFTIRKHVAPKKPAKPEDRSPELVSLKRPASKSNVEVPRPTKKAKSENGVEEEGKKSGTIRMVRLWNDDDTIAMLEGMISFIKEKSLDPTSDGGVFHEYVKDKLSVEVSTSQLVDKIRRLKKKYNNNADKGSNGEDPVLSKPYEYKCFQLSKKIWGGGGIQNKRSSKKKPNSEIVKPNSETVKVNREIAKENGNGELVMHRAKDETVASEKRDQGKVEAQEESFSQLYPFLSLSLKTSSDCGGLFSKDGSEVMEGCLRYLEKSKLEELEGLWKKQILAEVELAMGRSAIVKKQVELVSNWHSRRG